MAIGFPKGNHPEPGESIYFDSAIPHYGIPDDDRDVKFVMVIYSPSNVERRI